MMQLANQNKSIQQLSQGLENYLVWGYVDEDSFEEPYQEVSQYLYELYLTDKETALMYCKAILDKDISDDHFLDSICIDFLLLSDCQSALNYALNYLFINSETLSAPVLEKALFYFSCAKKTLNLTFFMKILFKKLQLRYLFIRDEPGLKLYYLDKTYQYFIDTYSLD